MLSLCVPLSQVPVVWTEEVEVRGPPSEEVGPPSAAAETGGPPAPGGSAVGAPASVAAARVLALVQEPLVSAASAEAAPGEGGSAPMAVDAGAAASSDAAVIQSAAPGDVFQTPDRPGPSRFQTPAAPDPYHPGSPLSVISGERLLPPPSPPAPEQSSPGPPAAAVPSGGGSSGAAPAAQQDPTDPPAATVQAPANETDAEMPDAPGATATMPTPAAVSDGDVAMSDAAVVPADTTVQSVGANATGEAPPPSSVEEQPAAGTGAPAGSSAAEQPTGGESVPGASSAPPAPAGGNLQQNAAAASGDAAEEETDAAASGGAAGAAAPAEGTGGASVGGTAAPAAPEEEDPGPQYAIPALIALATCLSMRQQAILELTSVDPDFLMALPADMQGEQISEAVRGIGGLQTVRTRGTRPLPAPTDDAVVAALPDVPADIRRELTRMLEQAAAPAASAEDTGPAEIDNATLFATLDPETRAQLLLEMDDESLATLPPEMVAEARTLRDRQHMQMQQRALANEQRRRQREEVDAAQRVASRRARQEAALASGGGARSQAASGGGESANSLGASLRILFEGGGLGGGEGAQRLQDLHSVLQQLGAIGAPPDSALAQGLDQLLGGIMQGEGGQSLMRLGHPGHPDLMHDEFALTPPPDISVDNFTATDRISPETTRNVLKKFQPVGGAEGVSSFPLAAGAVGASFVGAEGKSFPQGSLVALGGAGGAPSSAPSLGAASSSAAAAGTSSAVVAASREDPSRTTQQPPTLMDASEAFNICRLIFMGPFRRVRDVVRQVLYHVALHPDSRRDVLSFFLQILTLEMLKMGLYQKAGSASEAAAAHTLQLFETGGFDARVGGVPFYLCGQEMLVCRDGRVS